MSLTLHMADRRASARLTPEEYERQTERMARLVQGAEAIVVGGGSGLSSAAGHNHYHSTPAFNERFALFVGYYGFKSLMDGYYHLYSSYEEQWAFYAAYADYMLGAPVGRPYADLMRILQKRRDEGCPSFVITTNVDTQFERAGQAAFGADFAQSQLCLFQGSFAYLQCSQPCHDALYPTADFVRSALSACPELQGREISGVRSGLNPRASFSASNHALNAADRRKFSNEAVPSPAHAAGSASHRNPDAHRDASHAEAYAQAPRVPSDLVPRCPECGRVMTPWVRDSEFLQGAKWRRGVAKYEAFLREHAGKRVLFLELGVGDMTPGVIKLPFWNMTMSWENARMISIDFAKDAAPEHLAGKCLASNMDLAQAMSSLATRLGV